MVSRSSSRIMCGIDYARCIPTRLLKVCQTRHLSISMKRLSVTRPRFPLSQSAGSTHCSIPPLIINHCLGLLGPDLFPSLWNIHLYFRPTLRETSPMMHCFSPPTATPTTSTSNPSHQPHPPPPAPPAARKIQAQVFQSI